MSPNSVSPKTKYSFQQILKSFFDAKNIKSHYSRGLEIGLPAAEERFHSTFMTTIIICYNLFVEQTRANLRMSVSATALRRGQKNESDCVLCP